VSGHQNGPCYGHYRSSDDGPPDVERPDDYEDTASRTTEEWMILANWVRDEDGHVRAWVLAHGPVPPGMVVCHACDVPLCVNVDHLWLGTQGDNVRDAIAKGRLLLEGAANPRGNARITESDVRAIRAKAATSTKRELAEEYAMHRTAIGRIVNGTRWGWVK